MGYNTSGLIYSVTACASSVVNPFFCTLYPTPIYVAETAFWNEYNMYSPASSGIFGMGYDSALWKIIGLPDERIFDVSMTNYNGWTFADPNYKPVTTQSLIYVN